MPAIQPARLKQDVAHLVTLVGNPRQFSLQFEAFLDFYADRIQRPGQASAPPSILPTLNLPAPAMRQLILGLRQVAATSPTELLALSDTLWAAPLLEHRQVAAGILGSFSPAQQTEVLTRIFDWLEPGMDDVLLQTVLKEALCSLDNAGQEAILDQVTIWLDDKNPIQMSLGLQILRNLAGFSSFVNYPRLYKLITPIVENNPSDLRGHLLDVLDTLAVAHPAETAYFLQQAYLRVPKTGISYLIRQLLPQFSTETAESLRNLLKP